MICDYISLSISFTIYYIDTCSACLVSFLCKLFYNEYINEYESSNISVQYEKKVYNNDYIKLTCNNTST